MLITAGLLVFAYQRNLYKLIFILRVFLVIFTVSGFFNIFIDNMVFKDNYPDLLANLAAGGINYPVSSDTSSSTTNNSTATGGDR